MPDEMLNADAELIRKQKIANLFAEMGHREAVIRDLKEQIAEIYTEAKRLERGTDSPLTSA